MVVAAISQVSAVQDLPVYPIDAAERLEAHFFFELHHQRWLNSEFRLLASKDVRAVGFDLFCIAQNQAPVGTLPTSELVLAKLVNEPVEVWRELCSREISPLYKWQHCLCGSEVRWFHPVVAELAVKALSMKRGKAAKRERDRERKRLNDLRTRLVEAGAHSGLAKNDAFVAGVDGWLVANADGQYRTSQLIRQAMEAVQIGAQSNL